MNNKFIIISAPSGSGKSTIASFLLKNINTLSFSVSTTTRAKRKNEKDGIDYYFINKIKFNNHLKKGDFVEWEEVYEGDYKGTLKSEIDRLLNKNKNIIFDVDVKGGLNLKKYFGDNSLSVFLDVPNLLTLKDRLQKRGSETEKSINERIEKSKQEILLKDEFDVVILNDKIDQTKKEILSVINNFILT
jgi:guanylate kinase|tara:strand:- start:50715 stop:51281 length:567 start_codon:yes stop_codon:yes gene_type:complete